MCVVFVVVCCWFVVPLFRAVGNVGGFCGVWGLGLSMGCRVWGLDTLSCGL